MNNFKPIGTFDYQPILNELINAPYWNWLNLRSYAGHGEDIVLRYQSVEGLHNPQHFFDSMNCVDYFIQLLFPNTMKLVKDTFPNKQIGRIVFAQMKPGGEIKPHVDEGRYSDNTDRYHFVIVTNPSVIFTSGDEQYHMSRGTIHWFNNHINHSVANNGTTNRIHLIVDTIK